MLQRAKKLFRRRIAVFLAVLMAVSSLPVTAMAETEETPTEMPVPETAVAESLDNYEAERDALPGLSAEPTGDETASGTCGDGLTWTLADGVLTISGKGAMDDYRRNTMPWYENRNDVVSVVIEYGVTRIGEQAFSGCKLTSVSIPNSMVEIGAYAFILSSSQTEVYYGGTKAEWNQIAMEYGNNGLFKTPASIAAMEC